MIPTLNAATIGGQPPLKEFIALAKANGFLGIEFGIEEVARLADETSVTDVKDLFEDAGVAPASFGLPIEWRKDNARFRDDLDGLADLAAVAQAIGCSRVCTWIPPSVDDDALHFRNQTRERFLAIATVLGDFGIRFGLEWVGPYTLRHGPHAMGKNPFIWNMPGTLELIEDIDSPHGNVGLLVDSFHWFTTGATVEDLANLQPRQIVHAHINDAPDKPRDEQMDQERLLPGDGVIDLHAFLGALDAAQYGGYMAVEVFNKELTALGAQEAALRTANALRTLTTSHG